MHQLLKELRKKVVIGFVGGSDLVKISEQLTFAGSNGQSKAGRVWVRHLSAERGTQRLMISILHSRRMGSQHLG